MGEKYSYVQKNSGGGFSVKLRLSGPRNPNGVDIFAMHDKRYGESV